MLLLSVESANQIWSIPGIYQYFKSNNSSGHGRLWVCWFDKCRGFARSKAGDWNQTRPDLWPRPGTCRWHHTGPVVATKKTVGKSWRLWQNWVGSSFLVSTDISLDMKPECFFKTEHEVLGNEMNRAKKTRDFWKHERTSNMFRDLPINKWTIHPSFSWKIMSGSSWWPWWVMMSHELQVSQKSIEIHRNP